MRAFILSCFVLSAFMPKALLAQTRFTVVGNERIRDNFTGLEWQYREEDYDTWAQALARCEGLVHDGLSDWRLPNIKELISLMVPELGSFVIDSSYFARPDDYYASVYWYWSSTTKAGSPTQAWMLYLNGVTTTSDKTSHGNGWKRTRCVRGGGGS